MKTQCLKTHQVDLSVINQLWEIYKKYYDKVTYQKFVSDLKKKSHVFISKNDQKIIGFSTAFFYDVSIGKNQYGIIYSGDTCLEKEFWGRKSLHFSFLKEAMKWKIKNPGKKLYWNLIASGSRTYLVMAKNALEYYPRHDIRTPEEIQILMNTIGKDFFGDLYNKELGLIIPKQDEAIFEEKLAPFSKEIPELAFFLEKNPRYFRGEELNCLCRIDFKTVLNVGYRMVLKFFRGKK